MPTVTSLFPHKVAGILHSSVDSAALLRDLGLDVDKERDPRIMIPAEEYYDFLEAAARRDPDGVTVPLRVGASMMCDDYGAFGLAWKSALTLRGSYDRAERYGLVLSRVATYEVEPVNEGSWMHLHRSGDRRLGMRLSNEATIASILSISQQVSSGPFSPVEVHFKHRAPSSLHAHEEHFGCRVVFESDRDALLVSTESLNAPNRLGDPSFAKFFESVLEDEVRQLGGDLPLETQVRDWVSRQLSEGIPTISDVAMALAMSARTLQRRLAEDGKTYQQLVDAARRELSRRLLSQTDYSLIEVAFMTGFSGQSSFNRAFKRWESETPRSFRLRATKKS